MRQLLQNETDNSYHKFFVKCDRGLLQGVSGVAKCDRNLHYKRIGSTFAETHSRKHIRKHILINTFEFEFLILSAKNQSKELRKSHFLKDHRKM